MTTVRSVGRVAAISLFLVALASTQQTPSAIAAQAPPEALAPNLSTPSPAESDLDLSIEEARALWSVQSDFDKFGEYAAMAAPSRFAGSWTHNEDGKSFLEIRFTPGSRLSELERDLLDKSNDIVFSYSEAEEQADLEDAIASSLPILQAEVPGLAGLGVAGADGSLIVSVDRVDRQGASGVSDFSATYAFFNRSSSGTGSQVHVARNSWRPRPRCRRQHQRHPRLSRQPRWCRPEYVHGRISRAGTERSAARSCHCGALPRPSALVGSN